MLLAIDVGNSNLSAGVFQGETLLMKGKISVRTSRSADEYAATLCLLQQLGAQTNARQDAPAQIGPVLVHGDDGGHRSRGAGGS